MLSKFLELPTTISFVNNMCTVLGITMGIGQIIGMKSMVACALRRAARVRCPERELHLRSRLLLRLLLRGCGRWRRLCGLRLPVLRMALARVAASLDALLDKCREVQNPLCFCRAENEDFSANIDAILQVCDVQRPLPYSWVLPFWHLYEVEKMAEGSYGEIYLATSFDGRERVVKVVGVHGYAEGAAEELFNANDVIADALCSKNLSDLTDSVEFHAPNFPKAYSIHLATGASPRAVVDAWDDYREDAPTLETEHLSPGCYTSDSLFLVMELEDCGNSLLTQDKLTGPQSVSMLLQTASALAVAEEGLEFEHRDLHASNWLLRRTAATHLPYASGLYRWTVATHHVHAFLIDFTMSRIHIGGKTYFMDLKFLKEVAVDPEEEMSFTDHLAIYRMEEAALSDDYSQFLPKTNVLWLRHLAENLYSKLTENFSNLEQNISDVDKVAMLVLQRIKERLLNYPSAMEFVKAEVLEISKVSANCYS